MYGKVVDHIWCVYLAHYYLNVLVTNYKLLLVTVNQFEDL